MIDPIIGMPQGELGVYPPRPIEPSVAERMRAIIARVVATYDQPMPDTHMDFAVLPSVWGEYCDLSPTVSRLPAVQRHRKVMKKPSKQ